MTDFTLVRFALLCFAAGLVVGLCVALGVTDQWKSSWRKAELNKTHVLLKEHSDRQQCTRKGA